MLSNEEIQAMEILKACGIKCNGIDIYKVLLNLIHRYSKEIEELKEKNKNLEDELNKYIVKMSDEQYGRLVDIIRDETSKEWKDKIKAKIEELEKEKNIPQEMDFKAFYRIKDLKNIEIGVLQSLLEKE